MTSLMKDVYEIIILILAALVIWLALDNMELRKAHGEEVNVDIIIEIESGGNPKAIGKAGEIGLMQIMPIVLKEWNNYHPNERYTSNALFSPTINRRIGSWYLNQRIPQMLTHYNKQVSVRNIIIAYNAGISYVAHDKPIPITTKQYLEKYRRISVQANSRKQQTKDKVVQE